MLSHRFLVTYGASGPSITHEMLAEIVECYTLTQRDLKYTLIRTQRRHPRKMMTSFMSTAPDLRSTNVFGYEAVSMGSEIDDHPGMKLIVEGLGSEALRCWTAAGDLRSNRRGLLYRHLPGVPLETMSKPMLVKRSKEADAKYEELSTRFNALEWEAEHTKEENKRLKRRLEILESVGREDQFITASQALEQSTNTAPR